MAVDPVHLIEFNKIYDNIDEYNDKEKYDLRIREAYERGVFDGIEIIPADNRIYEFKHVGSYVFVIKFKESQILERYDSFFCTENHGGWMTQYDGEERRDALLYKYKDLKDLDVLEDKLAIDKPLWDKIKEHLPRQNIGVAP